MIIDSGSCTSVVSQTLVSQYKLPSLKYQSPYWFQWLSECGKLKVVKELMIKFKIGASQDEQMFDVVPMQSFNLLFGRPWKFDKNVAHDGRANTCLIKHESKRFVLKPLTPKQVNDDYHRMRELKEAAKAKSPVETRPLTDSLVVTPPSSTGSICAMIQPGKYLKGNNGTKLLLCLVQKGMVLSSENDIVANANPLPRFVENVLKVFKDMFPDEMPSGLPPLRGIEYQINFVSRS